MVKIRLRRVGAKKQPAYRVVVTDSRSPRDGRFIEVIGHYNPRTDPPTVVIREDRAVYWLSVGAQPTDAVALFFTKLDLDDKVKKVQGGADAGTVAEGRVQVSGPAEKPAPAAKKPAAKAPGKAAASKGAKKPDVAEQAGDEGAEVEAPAAEAAVEVEAPAVAVEAPTAEAAAAEVEAPAAEVEVEPEAEAPAAEATEGVAEGASELDELGLPARVSSALVAAGVTTVDQLRKLAAEGDEALLALPGIGAKAAEDIKASLGE
jgi:small subunit ribosomal protein S16